MKDSFSQLLAYLKPIKGHGTIGMLQRTIVYSEWVLMLSVVISIALECINQSHEGWIQFFENYAIGTACSVVIVLVTTITQFVNIRNEKFDELVSALFKMFSTLEFSFDIKKSRSNEKLYNMLNFLSEDIRNCDSLVCELFWFKRKYNKPFSRLSLKLLLLTTNLHKEYPPKDIYVDEKEVKRCIIQAKEFVSIVKPNSNNLLDLFDNYADIKSGEHNDQL